MSQNVELAVPLHWPAGWMRPERFCVPQNEHFTSVKTAELDALEASCARLFAELAALRAERTANMPTFVRRALAIAQAVDDFKPLTAVEDMTVRGILSRANELLKAKP